MTENKLIIGTAPDSWGVWFADDPKQTPWERFLDEVAESGYKWIELGPYGYLPNDPSRLAEELKARDLKVTAGTVFTAFHRGLDQWETAWEPPARLPNSRQPWAASTSWSSRPCGAMTSPARRWKAAS